jgi:YVTN family beta-propeller protein
VEVGSSPCGVQKVDGVVWVSQFDAAAVVRLDARTGTLLGTTTGTGGQPCGLAVGAGSLWTADYQGGSTTRIDLATGAVVARIPTGSSVYDVAFADGAAWVSNFGDGTVARVDADSNEVTGIEVGGGPGGIAWSGGFLWVANSRDGTVSKIDPASQKVVDTIEVGGTPVWTAFDDDTVFVTDPQGGRTVTLIDSGDGTVRTTIEVGGRPVDGDVAADGSAWLPDLDGRLMHVSADGELVGAWDIPLAGPFVLDVADGAVWVAEWQGTKVVRYDVG